MIQNVTFTLNSTGTHILWLFLLTIILSFAVTYLRCNNYNCSIKYGLLISVTMAIIYIILFKNTSISPEIMNILPLNLILGAIFIVVAVIPNIVIGVMGSSFAVFLKKTPKSKGITSKEISKQLEKRRK